MSYFRELPNISYISRFVKSNRSDERILVKNLFKRAKLRNDIDASITAFNYYTIAENERPDTLAKKIYDDSELDWVILITNNITSIRDQWPLEGFSFTTYLLNKYGRSSMTEEEKYAEIDKVHHWETTKVVDEYNRTILPEGLKVDKEFQFTYTKEVQRNKNISEITLSISPFSISLNEGDIVSQEAFVGNGYTFPGGAGTVKSTFESKSEILLHNIVGNFISTANGNAAGNPLLLNGIPISISGSQLNPSKVKIEYKTNTSPITLNPVKAVSRRNYETELNNEKRKIKILKPEYLSVFITDMRNVMEYNRSSQFLDKSTKKSHNPISIGV